MEVEREIECYDGEGDDGYYVVLAKASTDETQATEVPACNWRGFGGPNSREFQSTSEKTLSHVWKDRVVAYGSHRSTTSNPTPAQTHHPAPDLAPTQAPTLHPQSPSKRSDSCVNVSQTSNFRSSSQAMHTAPTRNALA